jgi:hypothetical protein
MSSFLDFFREIGVSLHLDFGEKPNVTVQIGGNGKRLKPAPNFVENNPPSDDSDVTDDRSTHGQ